MTDTKKDAPERIWLPEEQASDAAVADNGYGYVPYIRADLATPIAALVMRERAVSLCRSVAAQCKEYNLPEAAGMTTSVARDIEAIPLPCTDAELLAAAMRLPEIAAMLREIRIGANQAKSTQIPSVVLSAMGESADYHRGYDAAIGACEAALRAIEGGV